MALVVSSYLAPSIVGAPLSGRMGTLVAQRVGMITLSLALVALLIALRAGSIVCLPRRIGGRGHRPRDCRGRDRRDLAGLDQLLLTVT